MVSTSIQLFTLKDIDEPVWDVIARVGETSFDGIEFYDAHFDTFDDRSAVERTADALEEHTLTVSGAHVAIDRLESQFDSVISCCRSLDCDTLVIPTYESDAFSSKEGIDEAADRMASIATDLKPYDIELLYHNHTFEFGQLSGTVAFEYFVDAVDGRFGFQPDVGLATHAGFDAISLLDLVEDNAPIVHLTDSLPDDPHALHADPGTGVVDLPACVDSAYANGADWFVCENGRTSDPFETLSVGDDAFAAFKQRVTE